MASTSLLIVCEFKGHGGTQTQVLELLAAIDRTRVDCRLCTLNMDPALGRQVKELEVPVINLGLRGALRPGTVRALWDLAGRIREEKVRVVHGFLLQGNLVAATAARYAGVPYLTSVRNLELWKRSHEMVATRWAHRGAAAVTFNSRHVRDLVAGREGIPVERTRVIYNGLRPPAESPSGSHEALWPEGSDPRIICIASLFHKKGHRYLLEAFARILKELPRAGLLLVGEGAERGRIQARIRELKLGDRVRLAGHREDPRTILAAADLLVLTSIEEGMPNVLLEAMAAGVPQVATSMGGTPETVDDGVTALLVPPRDPVLLADRMVRILSDGDLRAALARKGRERFAARFGSARMAREHEELYLEVAR
jgi:glycosyltransferase involved in cell wall biosynthesis